MLPDIRDVISSLAGQASPLFASKDKAIGFQWVGLRQPDITKKCPCQGEEGTSDNSTCTRCLSTGYLFSDYLVKGYLWLDVLGVQFNSGPGMLSTQHKTAVIKHDRTVNKFDIILELDQDPDTGKVRQPFSITRYFQVQDTMPVKGDSGRIEFWKCNIEDRNILSSVKGTKNNSFKYRGNRSTDGI